MCHQMFQESSVLETYDLRVLRKFLSKLRVEFLMLRNVFLFYRLSERVPDQFYLILSVFPFQYRDSDMKFCLEVVEVDC